jgi:hypothetical protein
MRAPSAATEVMLVDDSYGSDAIADCEHNARVTLGSEAAP